MKNRYYTLSLPYHKQGDDLAWIIDQNKKFNYQPEQLVAVSLAEHAGMLEATARDLRKLAGLAIQDPIEIEADTHYIGLACSEDFLLKANEISFEVCSLDTESDDEDSDD